MQGEAQKNCMTILASTFSLSGRVTRKIVLPVMFDAVSDRVLTVHLRQGHDT